jgi:acyl phosphate:glycerol-3-phosphate acyltransferase
MVWLYGLFSYLIGNIMFGYLVSKKLYNKDIRQQGSGNVGARNAGRNHGKKAFVLTFLGDALKGTIVVIVAIYLSYPDFVQMIGLGLAIVGHILPLTLRFKGGKGISTFIGGIITFEPMVIPVIILIFILLYPFTKSFTISGMGALACIPLFLLIKDYDGYSCTIISFILLIIILVHLENLMERLKNLGRKA